MIHYPGTLQHQAVLQAIVAFYENDPRIRAVLLFGSLSRGNWDALSDIDLDVIIADGVQFHVMTEIWQLCQSLQAMGETAVLIIPDDTDAGDVVFASLLQLSIRYHPLEATHPNIVAHMRVLAGSLDHATIAAAGRANQKLDTQPVRQLLDRCLRYVVEIDKTIQRRNLWLAIELLHRVRNLLMEIFTKARGGERPYYYFQTHASAKLQARLSRLLPQWTVTSLDQALLQTLSFLEDDLEELTNDTLHLLNSDRKLIENVRLHMLARQEETNG
ncbi:MAG TPA: nucleotidyltransferase domain-containing protein [Chloroflexota bacterium]|nr:nucleotidyltransferase domain-containing protein [Chloroflexota bacterium]